MIHYKEMIDVYLPANSRTVRDIEQICDLFTRLDIIQYEYWIMIDPAWFNLHKDV